MKTFFKYNGATVTDKDFLDGLRDIGIKKGDTIFVASDITAFGKSIGLPGAELLGDLVNILKRSVGPSGTVGMPTYTYSFCKNKTYSIDDSPSTVGVLTEFFRKQPDVIRTNHPIFSIALWGRKKKELSKVGSDCFDDRSIFAKLKVTNSKYIAFGSTFDAFTFAHHIEQTHGVSYRKVKTFSGTIIDGSKTYPSEATYLVRPLDPHFYAYLRRFEDRVREKGYLK